MGPKVEAACRFVEATAGMAAIGRLDDAEALLAGKAGTIVAPAKFDADTGQLRLSHPPSADAKGQTPTSGPAH